MVYENLKSIIKQAIKQNGNQEITGNLLQSTLLNIVDTLGADYKFLGFATPSTVPPTSEEGRLFYFASEAGEYINFPTTGENTNVVTGEGLYMFTKEANSDYWKEETLIDIAQKLGDAENIALSQKLSSMIAAASSINNFSANIRFKSETGYIANDGSIEPIKSGIVLSFTVSEEIVKSSGLYLYGNGFADLSPHWATYAIFNSNNKLKRVGPSTYDAVSKYKNCVVKINKYDLVIGDIIKVSVNRLTGNAYLFYDTLDLYRLVIPDNEEVPSKTSADFAQKLGDAENIALSQKLSSMIAAASSINNFSANIRFKSETGYIANDGSIEPIKSGIVLSFTVSKEIVNSSGLYLYGNGFADLGPHWATYAIFNSNNKLKRVGPSTYDAVSKYKNCVVKINKYDLVIGDIIKVSVNRLTGNAYLFYDTLDLYRLVIPDNEEVPNIVPDNLNQWKGKKIVWIGTSIPWGQTSESGQTNPMANPYPKQIGELLGCTVLNHSQPGMSIRYNKDGTVRYGQCLSLTINELQNRGCSVTPFKSYENAVLGFDADLYVFDSEPNNGSVPSDGDLELLESFSIKNWAYSDKSSFASHRDTFVGAFIYIYDKLLNEKPNAKVILVGEFGGTGVGGGSGTEWETEYYNHTLNIAIAKKFNLPIFSLFELLGYNPKNVDIYMNTDRVHPKYAAHIRMANILKEKLLEVF